MREVLYNFNNHINPNSPNYPDNSAIKVNETSVKEMLDLNQRVVIYASDWLNFTNSSHKAYDACQHLTNTPPGGGIPGLDCCVDNEGK